MSIQSRLGCSGNRLILGASLFVVLVGMTAGVTGCGVGAVSTGPMAAEGSAQIGGKVHGVQQAIAFATVQLWKVGRTGYGSQGQLFATTSTADDGAGSFGFVKQPTTDTAYQPTGECLGLSGFGRSIYVPAGDRGEYAGDA